MSQLRRGSPRVLLLLWLAAAGCGRSAEPDEARAAALVLSNVRVIDVERGVVGAPVSVVIVEDRVAQIGAASAVKPPRGARRLDGGGRFLMPGLVDMHVHFFDGAGAIKGWMAPLFLAHGVTSVREMSARPEAIAGLRAGALAFSVRVAGIGVPVGGPVGADGATVGAADGAVAAQVAAAQAAGATFVKVFSEVPAARWRQILDEAKRRGLPVIGHAPAQVSLLEAASAGQRGVEHLTQVLEACGGREAELLEERRAVAPRELPGLLEAQEPAARSAFDAAGCARIAERVAASGQVHTPTLVLPFVEQQLGEAGFAVDAALEADPRWTTIPLVERVRWRQLVRGLTPGQRELAARRWAVARQLAATLIRAGVTIVAGTDAPQPFVYPGSSLHEELALLVAAGMTPAEALRAATLTPARVLGLADTQGTVAAGKRADLVLLDENPLDDIANTRRIYAVIFGGRWQPR